jgi:hypothetical protein
MQTDRKIKIQRYALKLCTLCKECIKRGQLIQIANLKTSYKMYPFEVRLLFDRELLSSLSFC